MKNEPIAWACELASKVEHSSIAVIGTVYSDWRPHLSWEKPQVPEGSIRNLRPLYEMKDAELAK